MKKIQRTAIVIMLALLSLSTLAFSQQPFNRAPDVLPGSDARWRNPSHWISGMDKPDEVILSVEAISRMNGDYQKKVRMSDPFAGLSKERTPDLSHWWPGYVEPYAPDLFGMTSREVAAIARERIKLQIEYLRKQTFGNVSAITYSEANIDGFENEMALENIRNDLKLSRGLAVRTTQIRNIPTFAKNQIGQTTSGERRFDMFNVCLLKIGKPVTVIHPSRSGEYLLVLSDDAYGWVLSQDIAFGSEEGINEFVNPSSYIVCTGDRVMLYSDESCTYASGWFRMGDRLPRARTNDPRQVRLPIRMTNGQLVFETAWLAGDAEVNEGWLPYTRRNVVELAFRLMDNAYDFTGGHFGRNHETTYRDIFACFGFKLPWHGALFTHFGSNPKSRDVAFPDKANNSKGQFETILSHEPFISLHTAGGHSQLLLGEIDGVPIVFDHHGYEYKTEDGTVYKVRRTCVGKMTNPGITPYMLNRPLTMLELR